MVYRAFRKFFSKFTLDRKNLDQWTPEFILGLVRGEKRYRARNTSLLNTWRMRREYKSSIKMVSLYLVIATSFSMIQP